MSRMKSLQLIYPYSPITLNNANYIQIGIEYPHTSPILDLKDQDNLQAILTIADSETGQPREYVIPERNILEFGDIEYSNLDIGILNISNPYLIIDIAYKTAD